MKTRPDQQDGDPFVSILKTEYKILIQILEARLPRSAQAYNTALVLTEFPEEMEVYSLYGDLSENAIVIIIFNREDYGQDVTFSVPETFQATEEIKKSFIDTKVIDWHGFYFFTAADRLISPMLFDISTFTYRNSVTFNPNYSFAMSPEDALKYEIEERPGMELKELDIETGTDFLLKEWKYSRENSREYLQKIIAKHISSGLYQDGKPVCGSVFNPHGLVGVLNTNEKHRRNGYAFTCMQFLFKQLAKKGFVPASSIQQENTYSMALHKKLGMKITHESFYILHIPFIKPN